MSAIKKILVTGACGYLGANISRVLAGAGFDITAFDLALPGKNVEWEKKMTRIILGDVRDKKLLEKLALEEFDAIIHLISLDHKASQNSPVEVMNINVLPTWGLLDIFLNRNLKTFIYFSTQQVLGNFPKTNIDENTVPAPINHYGLTHLLSENINSYYGRISGVKCINVRLSNGYGPPVFKDNNCWWLVVNDLCKTAYEKGRIVLLSDGSPQRDFIYVEDIGKALIKILENKISANIVNIGSGVTYSILELALMVREVYSNVFNRKIDIVLNDGSIVKDSQEPKVFEKFKWNVDNLLSTGFLPSTSLEEGIMKMFHYLHNSSEI